MSLGSSEYPEQIDGIVDSHQDGVNEIIHAAIINQLADCVMAIELELGLTPSGDDWPDVASRLDQLEFWTSRIISSNDLIRFTDSRGVIESDSATPVTVTIPTDAALPLAIGFTVDIFQFGAGQVSVGPAAGVTVHSLNGFLATSGPYAVIHARKRAANDWVLTGDLVAGTSGPPPPVPPAATGFPFFVGANNN